MSDARTKELEALLAEIPPCPDHGAGCITFAMRWVREAKKVMEREEKLRAAAASADPSTIHELLETQIRLVEVENERIKVAGAAMLIEVRKALNSVVNTSIVETIYAELAKQTQAGIANASEAVRAFGEAVGVPQSPSEKTE